MRNLSFHGLPSEERANHRTFLALAGSFEDLLCGDSETNEVHLDRR